MEDVMHATTNRRPSVRHLGTRDVIHPPRSKMPTAAGTPKHVLLRSTESEEEILDHSGEGRSPSKDRMLLFATKPDP
ncbi:hypothetical protein BHE74_00004470 [Ensete ventricosum]|nr:hypothetical protein BHE74_00004470 [Ensete ventricosum]